MTAAVFIFFFPIFLFNFTILPQNTGDAVAGVGVERLDYHSVDPTGTLGELSYAQFLKNTLKTGHIPFWSPFQALGHPFLAEAEVSATFAPLTVLRLLLPSVQWGILYVLNFLIGAVSIYALCRAYGYTPNAAAVGGITYLAVGTTQLYLTVTSVTSVAAWAPCLILGIEHLIGKRATNLKTGALLVILGAYGVITSGHITITLLTSATAAIYLCARLIQVRPALARVRTLAIAVVVAVFLTAVQWIPFVEYATYRGNTYGDYSRIGAITVSDVPAFFFPYLYGRLNNPHTETTPAFGTGGCWSLGWLPPGLLPFALAGVAALLRREQFRTGPFALAVASGTLWLWAFRVPPFYLASYLPFMNRMRGQYAAVTLGFTMCVLVALGFQYIEQRRIRLKMLTASTIGLFVVLTLWCGVIFLAHDVNASQVALYLSTHISYSAAWAASALGVLSLVMFRPQSPQALFFVAMALALFSAIAFFPWASAVAIAHAHQGALICFLVSAVAACFIPPRSAVLCIALIAAAAAGSRFWVMVAPQHLPHQHDLFGRTPYVAFLQNSMAPEYRAYGLDGYLFPNLSSAQGISSPDILTTIVSPQVERFYRSYLDAYQSPEQFFGLDRAGPGKAPATELIRNKRFWDYIGVRYIVSKDDHTLASRAVRVYRNGLWLSETANRPGPPGDSSFAVFGVPGDVPVMGDWNGDGRLKVGVFRKGAWFLDWNGNNRQDATDAALYLFLRRAGRPAGNGRLERRRAPEGGRLSQRRLVCRLERQSSLGRD